ncbi:flagellar motor protein MotB [Clostridium cellulovorans]|uniref:OmpA/MotB domain protein n=1 Tax=Clostridium cellulovorans (strain ATCC 35296 / DSM 3052 / OCM 3 / 743B) TaxID=573061 RepID=D9SNP1_CLOC7|nr:flagellar motor protein MotB [Clostridium cellulovorans]ADL49912.1 OmpA/MotB domain protein [Clostridium cellulovorans 743B]
MKKREKKQDNHERWLLTYSDLITLLMALFVILYATSRVDPMKFNQLAYSLQVALGTSPSGGAGVLDGGQGLDMATLSQAVKDAASKSAELDYEKLEAEKLTKVKEQVDKLIAESELNGSATTAIEERGLVITVKDNLFFDSGKATVKEQYKRQLNALSKILSSIDNYVRVEGHTDNVPIKTPYFNSNWQLSSIRASNVVEIFATECGLNPNRLLPVGYGEYRPIATNATEEGRAANRRVDIVILNSKFNDSEVKQR